jgi:hypothetical protein
VAWLVRDGKDPIELDRLAMPASLASQAAWDAVIEMGVTVPLPGDVIVTRLEVPDATGAAQPTAPGVFRVETASTGAAVGGGETGSGADTVGLVELGADDPLALAAVALIAPPPEVPATIPAGAGVSP